MTEENAYAQVAIEIAANELKPGLWAKSIADSLGDSNRAKSIYIKLRAEQLIALGELAEKENLDRIRKLRAIQALKSVWIALMIFTLLLMILCGIWVLLSIAYPNGETVISIKPLVLGTLSFLAFCFSIDKIRASKLNTQQVQAGRVANLSKENPRD